MSRRAIALLAAALLAGCIDAKPMHEDEVVQDRTLVLDLPMFGPETTDVLIVVDDSPAMAAHRDEVQALARAIPAILEARHYGTPELHVGVTTSDPNKRGALTTGTAQLGGRYLTMNRAGDGTWYTNYGGDLGDVLAQMVDVGASGEPGSVLDAMNAALRSNTNIGFVRPGAPLPTLTVVVISAGDDTGAGAPEAYAESLAAIEQGPLAIVLHGGAAPRLSAFAAAMPSAGQDHVLGEPPATALELLGYGWSLLELYCLNGSVRDTVPATTGVQPSCTAELDSDSVSLALSACTDGDTAPCYEMTEDPVSCSWPADQHLRLDFRNIGPYRPGHVVLECESGE